MAGFWRLCRRVSVVWLAAGLFAVGSVRAQEVERSRRALTLQDAVAMALRQSRELEQALLALEVAEGQVGEAWGNVFPKVNADAVYTRSLSIPGTFMPKAILDPDAEPGEMVLLRFGQDNTWNFQMRAEQPLFQAAAFLGVGAAGRYRALQGEMVRGVSQQVVTRTRIAFYDVLLAREAVRLSENSVRRVREVLDDTRARQRAGLASEYDVLRLEVELANLEPNLRRSRNALEAARRTLAVELGLEDPEAVEVVGSLAELDPSLSAKSTGAEDGAVVLDGGVPIESMTADEIVQLAIAHRSDLRQLELTESLREAELKVEWSEYLPKVFLYGTYSIAAQHDGSPVFFGGAEAARSYGRQVGIQVTLPLFSGMQRPARIQQKRAALRQVQTQFDLMVAHAENEVRTLLDQALEAEQRAAAQRLAVEQAQRGFEIASSTYAQGLGSQLEVTDAEVALRQSEFNYAQALYDHLVARARLDEAVGVVPMVNTGP